MSNTYLYWMSQFRGEETWDGGVNWLILSHNPWCLSVTNNRKASPYGKWKLETENPSLVEFKQLNRLFKKSCHSDLYFSILASFGDLETTDVKSWCLKRCDFKDSSALYWRGSCCQYASMGSKQPRCDIGSKCICWRSPLFNKSDEFELEETLFFLSFA